MQPALEGNALRIDTIEQVVRPGGIIGFERGTSDARLAAESIFIFIAHAAARTGDLQHQ